MTNRADKPVAIRGVTASSVSLEGSGPAADWSAWERTGRVPRSGDGAGMASESGHDIASFVALGCTDWRLTLEWARLEPEPGRVDHDAVDRYHDIVATASRAGLRTWITLHHGSLPGWYLDDEGGHRDQTARNRHWARHVDRVAELFDDVADGWVPIDDPIGWAVRGHGLGTRPPGRSDPRQMYEAIEGAMSAVDIAVSLLCSGRQPVMTAWRADPVHPCTLDDGRVAPEAVVAARRWDDILWSPWLAAHDQGRFRLLDRPDVDVPALRTGVDFVGLVHDQPVGVAPDGSLGPWPHRARIAGNGLAPEPDELGEAIARTRDALPDHQLVIAGHGVCTTDDRWRCDLLDRSLAHVTEAMAEGALSGYFHDSAIDGYEWSLGFEQGRGLIGRDRRPKGSAATVRRAFESWPERQT